MPKISVVRTLPGMLEEMRDDPVAIGRRLEAVRKILGYPEKKEFAAKAGIGPQTYGPWENGEREITRDGAKALYRTYGISMDFVFFGNKAALPHKIAKEL